MRQAIETISGKWHLLPESTPENHIPFHRVDFIFHEEAEGFRGAILNRRTGEEIPLARVQFDRSVLILQMKPPAGGGLAEMPTLTMQQAGHQFEGYWMKSATEKAVNLKLRLVRDLR